MKAAEIRSKFLKYFESKGHMIVSSSSLVPVNDPTLLFVNSGMVQFKDVFLGADKRPYTRATSAQRSVRAGGKHNDLENVGYTARHHTFFEMLGNFSFGDYFKREAIHFAWQLLTDVYKLPKEKLWTTVYAEDSEAYDIWTKEIGVPPERCVRIGDNKGARYASDNFWQMAETGPCGPCSEIFYDHGADVWGGPPGSADQDGDRYIEIWNLVFMQFERYIESEQNFVDEASAQVAKKTVEDAGKIGAVAREGSEYKLTVFNQKPLPKPCVDTGMGLERLAAILQHVHSNYEIDLFQNLIKAAARETQIADLSTPSLKVIADHIRACAFLVVDGVTPSNEGRGYVLRRIIRRAIRHGYKLGARQPFFYKLVADLDREMGEAYPELTAVADRVGEVLCHEEEQFFRTISHGMKILETALHELKKPDGKMLHGETAFNLHDTHGFPIDLTADVCREHGVSVDEEGFERAMAEQRERSRESGGFEGHVLLDYSGAGTRFCGYDAQDLDDVKVLAIYRDGASVGRIVAGEKAVVVLDRTSFYAQSGGQAGDAGDLMIGERGAQEAVLFKVEDTQKIQAQVFGHTGHLVAGVLNVGDSMTASVDPIRRAATALNHSATHLMHKALREVLGSHVQQKGSQVDSEKTRFDFSHDAPLTGKEIHQVELMVNLEILSNVATQTREVPIDEAQKLGAMMLFGEKYGDTVRVLDIGTSRELCGGTHVKRTGDIGFFKIAAQSGVSAGVRRVEAVTGLNAFVLVRDKETALGEIEAILKTPGSEASHKITQLLEHIRATEKELAQLKAKLTSGQSDQLLTQVVDVKGIKVLAAQLDGADVPALREAVDTLRDKLGSAAVVLAAVQEGKVFLIAGVTKDLVAKVKAGELVNVVAQQVGGKGGGRPDMAQAGGTDATHLSAALASVKEWVDSKL